MENQLELLFLELYQSKRQGFESEDLILIASYPTFVLAWLHLIDIVMHKLDRVDRNIYSA